MEPNQQWLEKRKLALDYLVAQFPESIDAGKPLKVGIFDDIRQIDDDKKPAITWLRRAMGVHASRKKYLKNLKEGGARVDLEGNTAGIVTAIEEAMALERLANLKKQYKTKPKSEKKVSQNKPEPLCNRPVLKLKK